MAVFKKASLRGQSPLSLNTELRRGTADASHHTAKPSYQVQVSYADVDRLKGTNRLTAKKVAINVGKAAAIVAGMAGAFALHLLLIIPKT
jgi:hypothetical protein